MRARLERDFERFRREQPTDVAAHVRETYGIDLTASYLGEPVPHPIGKASGQLSLNAGQLETDASAGLAFIVLKTVIAEDESGERAMAAWAVPESRMRVERRTSVDGREGWTVTWKGRGWDRTLDEYLQLVRTGRDMTRAGGPLVVPSVKYHLPEGDLPFRDAEYRHTTARIAEAWGEEPLLLEKDFSPTLAGEKRAGERATILRWLADVPERIRAAAPRAARVALKLMNARFDDEFQTEMVAAARTADALVVFNRLWDAEAGVAYGGWDLSERNLRVLARVRSAGIAHPPLSGTGNVVSGRVLIDYARAGCTSVQVHTGFQLPRAEYPAESGSRPALLMHRLLFDPRDGLIACMLELEAEGVLTRTAGELRFLDLAAPPSARAPGSTLEGHS